MSLPRVKLPWRLILGHPRPHRARLPGVSSVGARFGQLCGRWSRVAPSAARANRVEGLDGDSRATRGAPPRGNRTAPSRSREGVTPPPTRAAGRYGSVATTLRPPGGRLLPARERDTPFPSRPPKGALRQAPALGMRTRRRIRAAQERCTSGRPPRRDVNDDQLDSRHIPAKPAGERPRGVRSTRLHLSRRPRRRSPPLALSTDQLGQPKTHITRLGANWQAGVNPPIWRDGAASGTCPVAG